MKRSRLDTITLLLFISIWPAWLTWEITLLVMRGVPFGAFPMTLSMVAQRDGWYLNSVVYTWGGLATHYWLPRVKWATVWGSVLFWLITLTLLIQDVCLWNTDKDTWSDFLYWQRFPGLVLIVGALCGFVLFPQRGETPWNRPKNTSSGQ